MKTILLLNQYSGYSLKIIREELPEGFTLRFLPEQSREALKEHIAEADYVLAGGRLRITGGILDNAKKIVMIQRSGSGLDSIDLDAVREKGIPLYVNPGVNAESVAEHTLLLILACLRRLPQIANDTKHGIWKKHEQGVQTSELEGKTVGIVGMGHTARRLVELLKPFHVRIVYSSRSQADPDFERDNGMRFVGMDELLGISDVLTLHCPLEESTRELIREESIKKMKPGIILINTSRGGLISTRALAEALREGRIAYAALDVHETEPIPEEYLLKEFDNVILTPHIAGVTVDSFKRMMHDAFRNIRCFEEGRTEEIEPFRYC